MTDGWIEMTGEREPPRLVLLGLPGLMNAALCRATCVTAIDCVPHWRQLGWIVLGVDPAHQILWDRWRAGRCHRQ